MKAKGGLLQNLGALFIGVCFSCGLAFAGNFLQDTMKNAKDAALNKCKPDAAKLCQGVQANQVIACLKGQPEKLSTDCKNQLTTPSNVLPKNPLGK